MVFQSRRHTAIWEINEREKRLEQSTHSDTNIAPSGLSFTFQALHDLAADIRKGASPS